VDGRVRLAASGEDQPAFMAELARADSIEVALWTHARAVAEEDPRQGVVVLFTTTLNEMIDVHGIRVAALRNHVPEPIFWALVLISTLAVWIGSYAAGLARARQRALRVALAVLFATLITLVADLDRPRTGVIQTPQEAMFDLQRTIHAAEHR